MTDITLLDGGMGQELLRRSGDRPTPLWSTQVMVDHPGLVTGVHAAYFDAGATVATTNSYAIHRDRLDGTALATRFEELLELALAEAEAARADMPGLRIAGSLGPLVASYRPELAPPPVVAARIYSESVAVLAPGVDLFICETMASVAQAEGALRAALGTGKPVWLAVSVSDEDGSRLRSGEPLADLAPLLRSHRPDAVLVNCSIPEAIGESLGILGGNTGGILSELDLPFGAFANGFTRITPDFLADRPTVDALQTRADLSPEIYADIAMGWVAQGATIIGGCCEVGPAHIAEIAARLRAAEHRIV